jgi:6-phosphogluconolactonase
MEHELVVLEDAAAVAAAGAARLAAEARAAVAERGACALAVSGGRTPWVMFCDLAGEDVPWERVSIYQVDERIAPDGDPARNLTNLELSLGPTVPAAIHPMPVADDDVEAAADRYAGDLPVALDVVHLGLGSDGHTASLVPDDDVLDVDDRLVAITDEPYQGTRRMTLTYPGLRRARLLLWVVTGADKRDPLRRLLAGDHGIPAGRVEASRSVVLADREAAG